MSHSEKVKGDYASFSVFSNILQSVLTRVHNKKKGFKQKDR